MGDLRGTRGTGGKARGGSERAVRPEGPSTSRYANSSAPAASGIVYFGIILHYIIYRATATRLAIGRPPGTIIVVLHCVIHDRASISYTIEPYGKNAEGNARCCAV